MLVLQQLHAGQRLAALHLGTGCSNASPPHIRTLPGNTADVSTAARLVLAAVPERVLNSLAAGAQVGADLLVTCDDPDC